ncbi:hypothetical protein [Tepidanaerobacter syntrophicus]|uniref:hypothetical protein n=1 Tax=Tepidanaerobacter syntrophicus TaxID=224999 RepID=UPI001BD2E1F5|nr:hypothetical protein [Tepidanaerobacter syntrophicus]
MKKFFQKHWLYIIAFTTGAILTPAAIHSAYIQRGYFAIGGEYLIIPFMLIMARLVEAITKTINILIVSTKSGDMVMDFINKEIKKDAYKSAKQKEFL